MHIRDDPWFKLCQQAEKDARFLDVIESFRKGEMSRKAGMEFLNADGNLLHDTRQQSIMGAAQNAITGATTAKMLHPPQFSNLPPMYFSIVKKVRQSLGASVTLGATVGNITPTIYFGSSDAGTTLLATGVAQAGINAAAIAAWFITIYGKSAGGALVGRPDGRVRAPSVPLSHILSTASRR